MKPVFSNGETQPPPSFIHVALLRFPCANENTLQQPPPPTAIEFISESPLTGEKKTYFVRGQRRCWESRSLSAGTCWNCDKCRYCREIGSYLSNFSRKLALSGVLRRESVFGGKFDESVVYLIDHCLSDVVWYRKYALIIHKLRIVLDFYCTISRNRGLNEWQKSLLGTLEIVAKESQNGIHSNIVHLIGYFFSKLCNEL